jgi:SNF family Na+-dependent transporter
MLISEFGLTISATMFIIVILWFMVRKKIIEQVNLHSKIQVPIWTFQVVKILIPILLISTLTMKLIGFFFLEIYLPGVFPSSSYSVLFYYDINISTYSLEI